MEFKKHKRTAEAFLLDEWREWRLASVDEVRSNHDKIKKNGILESWDIARLLDGWVDGPGYRCHIGNDFRRGMGHMLLVKTKVSKPSDAPFNEEMYSGVKLEREGRNAALLLSCDDKITEVMCFVLKSIIESCEAPQAELDQLTKSLEETFSHRRTVLHYAADQPHNAKHADYVADLVLNKFEYGKETIKAADEYGRTALHFAALHGHIHLCSFLMDKCGLKADEKDRNGENLLHFVVNSSKRDVVKRLWELNAVRKLTTSQDAENKTLLHKAAASGNTDIIGILIATIREGGVSVEKFVRRADMFGQTALHEAVSRGHLEAVWFLLTSGSKPLERNSEGKTALHYAVQFPNQEKAKEMAWILLQHCSSDEERLLLLWASAIGIGTAEEYAESSPDVQTYLKQQRELAARSTKDLLQSAIKLGYEELGLELVNRGANTDLIYNPKSLLPTNEQEQVDKFRDTLNREDKRVKKMPVQGRDQPTIYDSLGRRAFAEGLAALFLNPHVKSPVTVGISGDWGMGKSSLMLQTETILLQAAAQLAFPNILPFQDFPGSTKFELTEKGQRKYNKVKNGVKRLLQASETAHIGDDPLVYFLDNYQDKYPQVYKSLALMDRGEMFRLQDKTTDSSKLGMAPSIPDSISDLSKTPTILTVQYNAWHYQNELEAWAGLAVTITEALEATMTKSQRIRSRCKYAWKERGAEIGFGFLLPCLLALFLSGWVALAVWMLLSRSKHNELKDLKYGSIPVTVLIIIWTVTRQLHSVFKSVSAQIMGYVRLPGHSTNLGYQHQVISDINFLKEQIREKPSLFWKFLAGNWLWRMFGRYRDTVKGTSIPKSPPHSKDDIRIIVFVDDLDRCQDTVILQVLSAINLVLAACEINVILGMDKKMIARAIAHKYQHQYKDNNKLNMAEAVDLAEKYLSKIVQLPLALPDDEIIELLNQQLGVEFKESGSDAPRISQPSLGAQPRDTESHPRSGPESGPRPSSDAQPNDIEAPQRTPPQSGLKSRWSINSRLVNCFTAFSRWLRGWSFSGPDIVITSRLKSMPINSQLIVPSYSEEEQAALKFLSTQPTDGPRIPRDWKRFLIYHRLAWNILFRIKQAEHLGGRWQSQLLVWIFCCWQWKDNINLIIKNWKELMRTVIYEGSSLKIIVQHYVDKKVPSKEKDKWQLLLNTLDKYDVPMASIQSFQKFRLHCEIGYLPPPPAHATSQ